MQQGAPSSKRAPLASRQLSSVAGEPLQAPPTIVAAPQPCKRQGTGLRERGLLRLKETSLDSDWSLRIMCPPWPNHTGHGLLYCDWSGPVMCQGGGAGLRLVVAATTPGGSGVTGLGSRGRGSQQFPETWSCGPAPSARSTAPRAPLPRQSARPGWTAQR